MLKTGSGRFGPRLERPAATTRRFKPPWTSAI